MKQINLLLITAFLSISTQAQKANSFLIYSVKGTVNVVENNKTSKAQIGKQLTEQSKLTVGTNSLVSIICNESCQFSIVKAGSYSMSQFKDSCTSNKSSITTSYIKYVWNQLTTHKGSPEKNRKSYMNNVGSVSRSNISIWIDSRFDTINYNHGSFPVSWRCYADVQEFTFEIYEQAEGGTPVYQQKISKTTVPVASFASKLQPNKPYFWEVKIENEKSEGRKVIYIWDHESYEKLLHQLSKAHEGAETEAEKNFRLGFLLESARFYAEAYQYYQKAVQLAPDVELFQKTLDAFKKDYNIGQ